MRPKQRLSLFVTAILAMHCQPRGAIEEKHEDQNSSSVDAAATDRTVSSDAESMNSKSVTVEESNPGSIPVVVTAMPASPMPRVESISFSHDSSLCAQVQDNRSVTLQKCSDSAKDQKFLFSRGLDGRFQLKDVDSQLCLGVAAEFLRVSLIAEPCESKSSQFFSVIDYESSYSLRLDAYNVCMDAENFGKDPGTRIIIYRCTAGINQKILAKRTKS